ncbi:MAG: PAS domain S-box-containing protein, partial [Planctomycetota bacterium]
AARDAFVAHYSTVLEGMGDTDQHTDGLVTSLELARSELVAMVSKSGEIMTEMRAGNAEAASRHMNRMDERFYGVLDAVASAELLVRTTQHQLFEEQVSRSQQLALIERIIAALVVLIVMAAVYYGHRVSGTMQRTERELHDTMQAAKNRRREIEAILAATVDMVIVTDDQGRIEIASDSVCTALALTQKQLLGRTLASLMGASFDHSSSEDAPKLSQNLMTRQNGSAFPVEVSVAHVELEEGRDLRVAIIRDISTRVQLETELGRAQKMEAVGSLAAGIAHEINTPIQFITDNIRFLEDTCRELAPLISGTEELLIKAAHAEPCEALAEELQAAFATADLEFLKEEVPRAIAESLSSVSRVRKIIVAMKEFSHPGEIDMTNIDLNRAIENNIAVAGNEWKYVAKVELDLEPQLPMVECISSEIGQVILSLVVNAAHAIGDANATSANSMGVIGVCTSIDEDHAVLTISDTGTGISEEDRIKIFDPFFTTKEAGKGTGQGLSIAYNIIVQKHGGTIEVESEFGVGTRFIIRLPLRQDQETAAALAA